MSAVKREGLAARLIKDSQQINEGLSELGLIPENQPSAEPVDAGKAVLMVEIEKKNQKIQELTKEKAELLSQLEQLEQENSGFRADIDRLSEQLAALQAENEELRKTGSSREIPSPDLDVRSMVQELKILSSYYARGMVSHMVAERTYLAMREMMSYLEDVSRAKRIREGEFWNVAIWFFHAVFSRFRDEESFTEMVSALKDSSESAEVLLRLCSMLFAYLDIDGWKR